MVKRGKPKPPGGRKNRWADHYTRRAKAENYPARSVFKLKEIQQKFRVLRRGDRVLDLGCAPGAWLAFAAETVGKGGRVVGVDLKSVTQPLPENARTHVLDVFSTEAADWDEVGGAFTVVLSDMAPATTGHGPTDALRSLALGEAALAVADSRLLPGGAFVCKLFDGSGAGGFVAEVAARFQTVKRAKPDSSRKASREFYIVATAKKQEE